MTLVLLAAVVVSTVSAQKAITQVKMVDNNVKQFSKTEFDVSVSSAFSNPYDEREIALNMMLTSPSGKMLGLPCYYVSGDSQKSNWKARFTPQESGKYTYYFMLKKSKAESKSPVKSFNAVATNKDGILHINDFWTLKFDSGKPFRGIGENVGWESRAFEDQKWTYDYLLPTLSSNGANFFRTWMCVWNLPVAWKNVSDTKRYSSSTEYYNPGGVERMDQLVKLCDSLNLHFMVSIDAHGAFIPADQWKFNNYNKANGGPATTPAEFFTNEEAKAMYKNRLRYLVARWGYSPSIGAWEFFNEIDNATFTGRDSILIPHSIITHWHDEMSTYLKKIDPYKHIVTTSISHRDIQGMNDLPNLDLNQKHIYNHTNAIPRAINEYTTRCKKPYVIGEFGYDWNWDNVKPEKGDDFDFDYKRGLWYGMFSPTPILPMTWWWEFFDDRNMTPYFKNVAFINDEMLRCGNGFFEIATVSTNGLESYAVKCGNTYFIYVLNSSVDSVSSPIQLTITGDTNFAVKTFKPGEPLEFKTFATIRADGGRVNIERKSFLSKEEMVFVLSPVRGSTQ
jgi:hypothetical protein